MESSDPATGKIPQKGLDSADKLISGGAEDGLDKKSEQKEDD